MWGFAYYVGEFTNFVRVSITIGESDGRYVVVLVGYDWV